MKAITTKYHGPTNTKGSRIKATDGDGNAITLHYRSELDSEDNHAEACRALCEKMGWSGTLQGGTVVKGGKTVCCVWCFLHKRQQVCVKPIKAAV